MKFMAKGWGPLALATLLSTVAAPAAILDVYSDRASWEAALQASPTTLGMTNSFGFNTTASGLSESGTSFVGFYNEATSGYFTYRDNPGSNLPNLNLGTFGFVMIGGGSTSASQYNAGFTITPLGGLTGIGFDFGSYADNGSTRINSTSSTQFLIRVAEGGNGYVDYYVNGVNRPNLGFFGITTTGNISGIQILTTNIGGAGYTTYAVVDNFSYGLATQPTGGGEDPPPSGGGEGGGGDPGNTDLPEPSTYALAGLGLLTMVYLRRRK
jgi:hypothetical protein